MDKHYPEAKLASDSKEYIVHCPWHEGSKRKLYVHAESGMFNCFVCGEKGSFYDLIRKTLNLKKDEVYEVVGAYSDLRDEAEILVEEPPACSSMVIPYPSDYYRLSEEDLGREAHRALDYLHRRGLNDKQVAYYKLGVCLGGKYAGRVITPTFDRNGDLVTYVGRDYTGNQLPKTLNNPALPGTHGSKDWVFNLYSALRTDHLIITEGTFDAIACGVSGVALFGKAISEIQIAKVVLDKPKRITVCLDADAAYDNEKLAQTLASLHDNVYIASLPEGDPASISQEVLQDCIKGAEKYMHRWTYSWL